MNTANAYTRSEPSCEIKPQSLLNDIDTRLSMIVDTQYHRIARIRELLSKIYQTNEFQSPPLVKNNDLISDLQSRLSLRVMELDNFNDELRMLGDHLERII